MEEDDRDLLLIAVFTTLTISLWIFFELVKTTKESTIAAPVQKAVTPLTSKIDTDVLNIIETRQTFD
jgi:hypothetical protein